MLCVRGGGILGLRPKGPLQGGVVLCRTENPLLTFQEATHVGRDAVLGTSLQNSNFGRKFAYAKFQVPALYSQASCFAEIQGPALFYLQPVSCPIWEGCRMHMCRPPYHPCCLRALDRDTNIGRLTWSLASTRKS